MKIDGDWEGVIGILSMVVFVIAVVIDSWELGVLSILMLMGISIDQNYQRKSTNSIESDEARK